MIIDQPVSKTVSARLRAEGIRFFANDAIGEHLRPGEAEALEAEVAQVAGAMLDALVIDRAEDHNTKGTAKRLAKMFVREIFRGRYQPRPDVTDFPNVKHVDELYTVGPITVRSTCSHHFAPIMGKAWVGVIPSERVIGLSKFNRLIDWAMSRPQIQEEAVVIVADLIEEAIQPRGLAVVIKAEHLCMTMRGVREHETNMVTSVTRGLLRERPEARAEFFSIIKGQGYSA
jgi:GTP cyclohydrolase I